MADFTGFDECLKKLQAMETELPKTGFRKALRDGAKVIAASMRSHAPNLTGATANAIKVRAGKRRKNFLSVTAGLAKGFFTGKTFYAGFLNYGWQTGKRGSSKRKKIPGTHWTEKAFSASHEQALAKITETLAQEVEKTATK